MKRFHGTLSVGAPCSSFPWSNTLKDKLTFTKLATREDRDRMDGEQRERERASNRAWGLLVPPVHILPLIPGLLYPLHLKQGCLLKAKTWILLDHVERKSLHMYPQCSVCVCVDSCIMQQVLCAAPPRQEEERLRCWSQKLWVHVCARDRERW